jgi:predicted MPP superfamily phosphohydrolase
MNAQCLLYTLLLQTLLEQSQSSATSFVFLADLHLGEGCNSSSHNYSHNDTNCYSVRDLHATVLKINSLVSNTSLIIVGGDLTSSAQRTEFLAAKHYLDMLLSPYICTIGNHDVWSYDEIVGDRTNTPQGDQLFSKVFHDNFDQVRFHSCYCNCYNYYCYVYNTLCY